jgi:NADH:ubiquinone oxidoreductase subunit E
MSTTALNITICLGSSCFSRGNRELIDVIQEYLEDIGMKEHATIKGGHCFGNCANGPVLIINGKSHSQITPESAILAIETELKK